MCLILLRFAKESTEPQVRLMQHKDLSYPVLKTHDEIKNRTFLEKNVLLYVS